LTTRPFGRLLDRGFTRAGLVMSAIGPERTSLVAPQCLLSGVKRISARPTVLSDYAC